LPRLKVKHTPACEVRHLLRSSPLVRRIRWQKYRVKEGTKGPFVWEAKCVPLWIKDERGLPDGPHPLLIARNVLKPDEVKFFLSNAPLETPVETLLLVAFSRWHIERLFEDSKTELGLDHFEVRRYPAITRHLLLSCVSNLFLAEFVQQRKKRLPTDGLPDSNHHAAAGAGLAARRTLLAAHGRAHRRTTDVNPTTQRRRRPQPPQTNAAAIMGNRNTAMRPPHLSVAEKVAL
jgi:hypothetical protein